MSSLGRSAEGHLQLLARQGPLRWGPLVPAAQGCPRRRVDPAPRVAPRRPGLAIRQLPGTRRTVGRRVRSLPRRVPELPCAPRQPGRHPGRGAGLRAPGSGSSWSTSTSPISPPTWSTSSRPMPARRSSSVARPRAPATWSAPWRRTSWRTTCRISAPTGPPLAWWSTVRRAPPSRFAPGPLRQPSRVGRRRCATTPGRPSASPNRSAPVGSSSRPAVWRSPGTSTSAGHARCRRSAGPRRPRSSTRWLDRTAASRRWSCGCPRWEAPSTRDRTRTTPSGTGTGTARRGRTRPCVRSSPSLAAPGHRCGTASAATRCCST